MGYLSSNAAISGITRMRWLRRLKRSGLILHGRRGVIPASEHREILFALASLIRSQ